MTPPEDRPRRINAELQERINRLVGFSPVGVRPTRPCIPLRYVQLANGPALPRALPLVQAPEGPPLEVPLSHVEGLGGSLFHGGVVRTNQGYLTRARHVGLVFAGNNRVDGFVTEDRALVGTFDPELPTPVVVLNSGLCRAAQALAVSVLPIGGESWHRVRPDAPETLQAAALLLRRAGGCFTHDAALELVTERLVDAAGASPAAQSRAMGVALGALLTVAAHELGHVCLEHKIDTGGDAELAWSQNRESDKFVTRTLKPTPHRDYASIGGALAWWILAQAEPATAPRQSRERLKHFLHDHAEELQSWGATAGLFGG